MSNELILFILMTLALSWWWRPRPAGNPAAWILLAAFTVLGGIAFWWAYFAIPLEAHWVFMHWKPTVLYWTLSAIFWGTPFLGWDYPAKWVVFGTHMPFVGREWFWLNRALAIFYAVLGGVNLVATYYGAEADWVGFKEACYLNLVAILLVRINFVWLPILKDIAVLLYRFVARFINV